MSDRIVMRSRRLPRLFLALLKSGLLAVCLLLTTATANAVNILYALTYDGKLYEIDKTSAVATSVRATLPVNVGKLSRSNDFQRFVSRRCGRYRLLSDCIRSDEQR